MPAISFKEIPEASRGESRDSFELFARDFLEMLGYGVLAGPDRGPDGGRDLIVEEIRSGVGGETRVRWLVSCKHKAHSGSSVQLGDELDIHDRLQSHDCRGFIGFYSTVPSSGLTGKLRAPGISYEAQVFDQESIEGKLLSSAEGILLARRYFPVSLQNWERESPKPAEIFAEPPEIKCDYCHADLLTPRPHGNLTLYEPQTNSRVEEILWCCKGNCDRRLERRMFEQGLIGGWEDIADLAIPTLYIRFFVGMLNETKRGDRAWSDGAFDKGRTFLLKMFPHVARHLTESEKERVSRLANIPRQLGGLDYGHD